MFVAMGVSKPVCDQCSVGLKEFPCPVVHFLFDYALEVHNPDGVTDKARSFAMKGGLAMCPECFDATVDELNQKGEEIVTDYKCGCHTQKVGTHFFIKPCSPSCIVFKTVIERSEQRGNEIEFRRNQ